MSGDFHDPFPFTVLGGAGFVGSQVCRELERRGIPYWSPRRDENLFARPLGRVIYCIGVTADFRQRPYDTVRAHVSLLVEVLERAEFESFLYLSSTRMYYGAPTTGEETALRVNPQDLDQLYGLSKLTGEAVCRASGRQNVRVARLSNVYGGHRISPSFLYELLHDAFYQKRVVLRTALDSERDYVAMRDVVAALLCLAVNGNHFIYNVASGITLTHRAVLDKLQQVSGCEVVVLPDAPTLRFPPIDVRRLQSEFPFAPASLLDDFDAVWKEYTRDRETTR